MLVVALYLVRWTCVSHLIIGVILASDGVKMSIQNSNLPVCAKVFQQNEIHTTITKIKWKAFDCDIYACIFV